MNLPAILPPTAPPWVLVLPAVIAFFVSLVLVSKLLNALFPHANLIRAREIDRAMRNAPEYAVSDATIGTYVRPVGTLAPI